MRKKQHAFFFSQRWLEGAASLVGRWSSVFFFLFFPFFLPHGDALVLVLGRERAHGEVEAAGGREGLVVVAGATGGGEGEHHGKKANV